MIPSFDTMKQYIEDTFLPYVTNFKNLLGAYKKHYDAEIDALNQKITQEANRLDDRIDECNAYITQVEGSLDDHAKRQDNPHLVGFDQLKNITISSAVPGSYQGVTNSLWIQYLP